MFFCCSYGKRIWKEIMKLFDPGKISLKKEYSIGERNFFFYQKKKKKLLKAYVCRLALGHTVYHIWKNRNEIKHGTHPLSTKDQMGC
jgi:hypothetical protein